MLIELGLFPELPHVDGTINIEWTIQERTCLNDTQMSGDFEQSYSNSTVKKSYLILIERLPKHGEEQDCSTEAQKISKGWEDWVYLHQNNIL